MSYSVCVYCGASEGVAPRFAALADAFGRAAAARGARIVYGGGKLGLMGAVADAAQQAAGEVLGVIPRFLVDREQLNEKVPNILVETMHERKMRMFRESDAFCVLPGGIGTLEEVVETLSWARLDLHSKPIVLLNMEGYWNGLIDLMEGTIAHGFTPESLRHLWTAVDDVEGAFAAIEDRLVTEVG